MKKKTCPKFIKCILSNLPNSQKVWFFSSLMTSGTLKLSYKKEDIFPREQTPIIRHWKRTNACVLYTDKGRITLKGVMLKLNWLHIVRLLLKYQLLYPKTLSLYSTWKKRLALLRRKHLMLFSQTCFIRSKLVMKSELWLPLIEFQTFKTTKTQQKNRNYTRDLNDNSQQGLLTWFDFSFR